MNHVKKKLFSIFLLFYFLIGSYSSLNTGISFDEYHEEKNWKFHKTLTKHLTKHIFLDEEYDQKFDKKLEI